MLAQQNDSRGGDSWGVVGIDNNNANVKRGIGYLGDNAHELFEYNTLFMHTRFATNGLVNVKNAHPFKMGKLLGAHNGMIRNHEELNAIHKRKFEVDSQHIFAHINAGLPLEELEGYGTIEWIKRDDPNTIFLARFRGGELAVYGIGDDSDNPDGIVWSSSYRHLIKSLVSSGITNYFRYGLRTGRVYSVNNGKFSETGIKHNLSAPASESVQEEAAEKESTIPSAPPRHLIRKHSYNPLIGRKIDHFRLFRKIYSNVLSDVRRAAQS